MKKHFQLPVQQVIEKKKTQFESLQDWAKSRQEVLAIGALLLILLAFGVPYYQKSQLQAEKDASNMLAMAEVALTSSVDPTNGPYKTEQEKYQQSLDSFQRVLNNYGGTAAAKAAQYYVGKCHYLMGNLPQAYASFDVAMSELKDSPLGDAAALGKIYALAAQDKNDEVLKLYESFLQERSKSYLEPEARLGYSEALLKSGNRDKAVEALKSLSQDRKDTFWGREAARKLRGLGA